MAAISTDGNKNGYSHGDEVSGDFELTYRITATVIGDDYLSILGNEIVETNENEVESGIDDHLGVEVISVA